MGRLPGVMWIGAVSLLASCAPTADTIENQPPFVRLAVPARGERLSYATTFHWTGWDKDGLIDHYEYAVDIPEEIPLDRINDPANTEVAWQSTGNTEIRFQFATPREDSLVANGTVTVYPVDIGEHCVYVRSVDNEGSPSEVDFLCFTAENVHPRTQIDLQCATGGVVNLGRERVFRWTAEDPDAPDAATRPTHTEWKLIEIDVAINVLFTITDFTYLVAANQEPWIRAEGDSALITLVPPRGYLLAVRATDEHGGAESRFLRGRNVLLLRSLSTFPGSNLLTISHPLLGSHTFGSEGPVVEFEIPVNFDVRFDLTVNQPDYCVPSVIEYNWGVDVSERDDERQFNGWSRVPVVGPVRFTSPGVHFLTIQERREGKVVVQGTVILRVISLPRDRDILYVDDYRQNRQGNITDVMMDARVQTMISDASPEFFTFDVWGDQDLTSTPSVPRLSDLARYKLVLWSVFGSGAGATNGLVTAATCGPNRLIQLYLSQGGGVWIYGDQVWGSFRQFRIGTCKATLGYSESTGLHFNSGEFPCDFMKICGGDFREAKTQTGTRGVLAGLLRAVPTAEASQELFPAMEVDSTVFFQPAIPFVDAMFQPNFDQTGGLDSLYTMRTVANNAFNHKPVAFRYFDPDPASQQGPIAIFGFSFHLLKQGSWDDRTGVRGMTRSMVDWFRSHQRTGT